MYCVCLFAMYYFSHLKFYNLQLNFIHNAVDLIFCVKQFRIILGLCNSVELI